MENIAAEEELDSKVTLSMPVMWYGDGTMEFIVVWKLTILRISVYKCICIFTIKSSGCIWNCRENRMFQCYNRTQEY